MKALRNICILISLAFSIPIHAQTKEETLTEDSIPTVDLNEFVVKASTVVNNPQGYRIMVSDQQEAKSRNTVEFLDFLPNISIENEIIKINGTPVSEVRINGRKVQDNTELQNLPAQLIKAINVKYIGGANKISDNAGGIIDIELIRTPANGFYGSVSGGAEYARRMGFNNEYVGGVICAKIGNANLYEAPYARWMDVKEWSTQSVTELESGMEKYKQSLLTKIRLFSYTNNLALNYEINPKHNIGISWFTAYSKSCSNDIDDTANILQLQSKPRYFTNVLSANYSGRLSDSGDNISFSAEWMNRSMRQSQYFHNVSAASDLSLKENSDIVELNLDYGHIFNGTHQLNAGMTYKLIDIYSKEDAYAHSIPTTYTDMKVRAQTPLVYASMSGKFGVFQYYGALNWQMNSVKVDAQKATIQNAINPTLQLSMPFGKNKNHNLSVIYKHILDRIPYDAISEKKMWSDAYNYSVGNMSLKAPTEHFVSVIAGFWNNKLNLSASYAYDDNTIFWQTYNDPGNPQVFYTMPVNIGGLSIYALRTEFTQRLFDAWTIKAVARVAFNTEDMDMSGAYYKGVNLRQFYSLSNSLSLKGWGAGLNAYVEPTYKYLDRTYHTVYQIECRLYKTFFDDNLQIILNFIPYEKRRKLTRCSANESVALQYTTPPQRVGLRVVWYFSGGKKDIRVNVKPSSLNYVDTKDNL